MPNPATVATARPSPSTSGPTCRWAGSEPRAKALAPMTAARSSRSRANQYELSQKRPSTAASPPTSAHPSRGTATSTARAMAKAARYIEALKASFIVSVSLIVQIMESPLTRTRRARSEIMTHPARETPREEQPQPAGGHGYPQRLVVEAAAHESKHRRADE